MTNTAPLKFLVADSLADSFCDLFPHRFDFIYAPHPQPGTKPNWQTESRYPLANRLLKQASYLYGVRFGPTTEYALLDVDIGSPYHPRSDPFAVSRMLAALEPVGLVSYLACTSSYSGGLHLYLPFSVAQRSWQIGAVITSLLETAGFTVKSGYLEVFPNRRSYSPQGKPSLFNAHRLPLQSGSYLLNRDFEPVWSDQQSFVKQWQIIQRQNQIVSQSIQHILKQTQRRQYQVSGRAAKFINDLNAEIGAGWSGYGQTNYLLGRIAMRSYIFHHILEGGPPLVGQALVDQIVTVAKSLPGYQDWCRHQQDIQQRAAEWAKCVESSHYFHYGVGSQTNSANSDSTEPEPTWNQQRSDQAREKISQAIAKLLDQNMLPIQATARFRALTAMGIGGGTLYRHKDLWHPEFLYSNQSDQTNQSGEVSDQVDQGNQPSDQLEPSDQAPSDQAAKFALVKQPDQSEPPRNACFNQTNLLPNPGGNAQPDLTFSDLFAVLTQAAGSNALNNAASTEIRMNSTATENFLIQSYPPQKTEQLAANSTSEMSRINLQTSPENNHAQRTTMPREQPCPENNHAQRTTMPREQPCY